MIRCPRCDSADLAVTDASDPQGFRIVCRTCGHTSYSAEL